MFTTRFFYLLTLLFLNLLPVTVLWCWRGQGKWFLAAQMALGAGGLAAVAWNLWCMRKLQRQARAQALADARIATWRIRAERGVIVSELLWGLLGLALSCVAGLALWAVYPKYPPGAGMLACIGAVLVVGAALRSRRAPELPAVPPLPRHIHQVSRRQQGIPRRPLDVAGAGPHPVRRGGVA